LPDAHVLVNFFTTLLLQLNIQRDQSGNIPQSCDLTLTDIRDIQKQVLVMARLFEEEYS